MMDIGFVGAGPAFQDLLSTIQVHQVHPGAAEDLLSSSI